jgi:hypothetical protein
MPRFQGKKLMKTYIVTHKDSGARRLVEAKGPGGARQHVTKEAFTVAEVNGRALIEASQDLTLETAGDEPEAAPATGNAED